MIKKPPKEVTDYLASMPTPRELLLQRLEDYNNHIKNKLKMKLPVIYELSDDTIDFLGNNGNVLPIENGDTYFHLPFILQRIADTNTFRAIRNVREVNKCEAEVVSKLLDTAEEAMYRGTFKEEKDFSLSIAGKGCLNMGYSMMSIRFKILDERSSEGTFRIHHLTIDNSPEGLTAKTSIINDEYVQFNVPLNNIEDSNERIRFFKCNNNCIIDNVNLY